MDAETVSIFLGKPVKLRKKDGYSITGTITDVKKDCLIFQSRTSKAVISLDTIDSIVENGGAKRD